MAAATNAEKTENNTYTGKYKFPPIPGRLPVLTLPKGTALVLEGGGTRGFYSAGVFEAFMEKGIMFPYIAGVSAGAANALTYLSGQPMRSRQIVEHYVGTPRYVGKRNLILKGSLFNIDFIFNKIPNEYVFFDWETFGRCNTEFYTGAMNCDTGKTEWFGKEHIYQENICPDKKHVPNMKPSIASCAIPLAAHKVRYNGLKLYDGGISDPIPVEKSIADGNSFHVIVLTQNKGYIKPPFGHDRMLKMRFFKYPEVTKAMLRRHEVYNRQVALCEELEAQGKAVIIRPLKPLKVGRSTSDTAALLELYDEGHQEGREKISEILGALK